MSFFTTNPGCSGCGLMSCDGRCFLECEADYEEQPDLIELERMRKMDEKRKAA